MVNDQLYHEKQTKQLCALHALNNLFQDGNAFSQRDLDNICQSLSPSSRFINPHKSSLGLGNYDVNVIMGAVQSKNLDAVWFDKRKNPEHIVLDNIKGFILNIPNTSYGSKWTHYLYMPLNFLMSKKHWISVVKHEDKFFNLDSKLEAPEEIGSESDLVEFLKEKNTTRVCEIFVIVSKVVSETHSWLRQ